MTEAERLAAFALHASYDDLSHEARESLKLRILDALGCAIGATDGVPPQLIRHQLMEFDGGRGSSLIGGGTAAPDRVAFYNGALIRYLDFNDSYLAKGESCHPSDNLAPVLAVCEYEDASGRDLLTALAVAYQVQCRLSDEAPVRARGFDHTTQGAYAVAAGISRGLLLTPSAAANALAMSGAAFNALRVTRTGLLSHWKGVAYANMASGCVGIAFLARRGMTGPLEVFEGNKGFMQTIGGPFAIDWAHENLERVTRTIMKRHNAEVHAQTAIDAALELKRRWNPPAAEIARIDVEVFEVAHAIIGGGEEGDKTIVQTKESADHSLPYLIAAAMLDGEVLPPQFALDRVQSSDIQQLLRRISVHASPEYSSRFPAEMLARVEVRLVDGRTLSQEVQTYPGLNGPPMSWPDVLRKFEHLCDGRLTTEAARSIADAVRHLESVRTRELTSLLAGVHHATAA